MAKPSVERNSESDILSSTVILLIQLDGVETGDWKPESEGSLKVRPVILKVNVVEVLKGAVRQRPGEPFTHNVVQRGTGTRRIMDYYGLWSHVALRPGVRYVAFCIGDSDDAAILLTDAYCRRLVEPDPATEDVRQALALDQAKLSTAEWQVRAADRFPAQGPDFARYVWARTKTDALIREADEVVPQAFEWLMQRLEDAQAATSSRVGLLGLIYKNLGMVDPPLRAHEARFIRTMFKLLAFGNREEYYESIGDVYLPNLLGLEEDSPYYTADSVFKENSSEREAARACLQKVEGEEFVAPLLKWLK